MCGLQLIFVWGALTATATTQEGPVVSNRYCLTPVLPSAELSNRSGLRQAHGAYETFFEEAVPQAW